MINRERDAAGSDIDKKFVRVHRLVAGIAVLATAGSIAAWSSNAKEPAKPGPAVAVCEPAGPWLQYNMGDQFDEGLTKLLHVSKQELYGGRFGVAVCSLALGEDSDGQPVAVAEIGQDCAMVGVPGADASSIPPRSIVAFCATPNADSEFYGDNSSLYSV